MATFNTSLGKVRYSGRFRYVAAVPNPAVATGTSVIARSNSASTLTGRVANHRQVVVIDTTTGQVLYGPA